MRTHSQFARMRTHRRARRQVHDVTFVLRGGVTLGAHRGLLACASDFFAALFKQRAFAEAGAEEIALDDVEPDVFGALLDWLYTGDEAALLADADIALQARRLRGAAAGRRQRGARADLSGSAACLT